MDGVEVDRLARAFARMCNRRRLMATIGAFLTVLLGPKVARGFQLAPVTCGEEGAVCTLISRCCDGLTCVTSAINTSWGICVPGDGGMVATDPILISPFSQTAVEELRALMETDSTTSQPEPKADAETRATQVRARREARRTERRSRVDTKRATTRTRRNEQHDRQRNGRKEEKPPRGLQLQLKLVRRKVDGDPEQAGMQLVPIEVVRVTNEDERNVVLTRIETIRGATVGSDLPTSLFALRPGESYSFISGLPTADASKDKYQWLDKVMCDGTLQGQGYRVKAALSRGGENHDFVVRCAGPRTTDAVKPRSMTLSRKGNQKNDRLKHKRNGHHPKQKKR